MARIQTGDDLKRLHGKDRLGQNRESEYLGAEDIDPQSEPILTISGLYNGEVTLQKGRENKDVMTFAESSGQGIKHVRPLIVNSTNRKTLKKLYGSVSADTLEGKRIKLYVDHRVRDPENGGMTDGIRIRNEKPAAAAAEKVICEECGKEIQGTNGMTASQTAAYTKAKYKKALCYACAVNAKAAKEADGKDNEERITENENNTD